MDTDRLRQTVQWHSKKQLSKLQERRKRQSPPVLETDGSQISRLAQLENKVGRITDTETRRTPKNQEKTSVATTPKRIRNRHKESAITHNTKKSVGIIKKIAEPVAKTIMLHETMIAPTMHHNSTQDCTDIAPGNSTEPSSTPQHQPYQH